MNGQNNNFKLEGKIIITADIRCITGLHIGGTEEGFEIGGAENIVIKDPMSGLPYIPGSSLKGKLRSLLEWTDKSQHDSKAQTCVEYMIEKCLEKGGNNTTISAKPCDCGKCDVCIIFGSSAAAESNSGPTRLIVRDAFPKGFLRDDGTRNFESEQIKEWEETLGEKIYTELKTENTIDRLTSSANPRIMERVPADSVFEVEMIFDLYKNDDIDRVKKVFQAMRLLEDSALGGGGSRGSGKIKFENIKVEKRSIRYYEGDSSGKELLVDNKTVDEILKNFDQDIKRKI